MDGTLLIPASSLPHEATQSTVATNDIIFANLKMYPVALKDIWNVNKQHFNDIALQIFRFQAKNNPVYAEYLQLIDQSVDSIHHWRDIPFLPIQFFKSRKVVSYDFTAEKIFESSSTTGIGTSKHHIEVVDLYLQNCQRIFELRFGKVSTYRFIGLLPNYQERGNSSLICMVDSFMQKGLQKSAAYYLYNHSELAEVLLDASVPTVLFGVSFALLDFASSHSIRNENLIVIETGGMKGRAKELTKAEVYEQLKNTFSGARIESEYGMTELMSQAYTIEEGIYMPPAWMKVICRTDSDPLSGPIDNRRGALNIIDLANIHSCAFIATDDLGMVHENGSFEVIGRLDYSDLRGCSLLAS